MTDSDILPLFRSDLEVLPSGRRGDQPGYIFRDPRTDWVFELDEPDYFVCQRLDGQTTLGTLQAEYEERFGEPLTARQLERFIDQLRETGLLIDSATVSTGELDELYGREEGGATRIVTFPGADRLFGWLARRFGWLLSRAVLFATLPFIAFAAWLVLRDPSAYFRQFDRVWEWTNLTGLVLVGLFLVMIPRELVNGLACKYYGGTVAWAGVIIGRLRPRVSVDVSSIRWLPKSQRIKVIFAHGYVPIVAWAAGTIGSWLSTPWSRPFTFWMLLSATGGWSTLWNWNPKLPRDGYHLLQTWSGIPRLRRRSMNWVLRRAIKWAPGESLTPRERRWFVGFGILAWVYVGLHVYILWGAAGQFLLRHLQGWGFLIAVVLLYIMLPEWWGKAAKRPVRWVLASDARVNVRLTIRLTLLLIFLIAMFIPYPYETGGPFKVLAVKRAEVHIEIEGSPIQTVPVREGQWIKQGDVLARVDPREFQKNLDTSQAQLAATVAQLNLLRKQVVMLTNPPNIEEIQRLEAETRRLTAEVDHAKRELELAILRAPIEGRVVTPYIDQKVGQFLKKGDLFATIQDSRTVEIEISVPEGDVPEVRQGARVKVGAWAYPHTTFMGDVFSIGTIANLDPALQLMVVRVLARIPNETDLLKADSTGYAKIYVGRKPLWDVLSRRFLRWIKVEVWSWLP